VAPSTTAAPSASPRLELGIAQRGGPGSAADELVIPLRAVVVYRGDHPLPDVTDQQKPNFLPGGFWAFMTEPSTIRPCMYLGGEWFDVPGDSAGEARRIDLQFSVAGSSLSFLNVELPGSNDEDVHGILLVTDYFANHQLANSVRKGNDWRPLRAYACEKDGRIHAFFRVLAPAGRWRLRDDTTLRLVIPVLANDVAIATLQCGGSPSPPECSDPPDPGSVPPGFHAMRWLLDLAWDSTP